MNPRKLLNRLASTRTNVRFGDLLRLVKALGFDLDRVAGSHHVFIHPRHPGAQLNLQPDQNHQAKAYQVRQLLSIVEEYNLTLRR